MNVRFIAIFLCVFPVWMIVRSQKCNFNTPCHFGNCTTQPPYQDDEDKLDRACATNKCNFDFAGSGRMRRCVRPGSCAVGEYCSDCITPPSGPENFPCRAGLNCNKATFICEKKPQCKPGEYCKRGDCEGEDGIPTVADDDACVAGSVCSESSFICVKISTTTEMTTPTTSTTDKEKKQISKWWKWLIGFYIGALLLVVILGSIWYFLCNKKDEKNIKKKNKPRVSFGKGVKENQHRLSKGKEVKEKKPSISAEKEVKEKKPSISAVKEAKKSISEVKARKSTSPSLKLDSNSPYFSNIDEKSKSPSTP